MSSLLRLIDDVIWAAFFDDNEWWIKAKERIDPLASNPIRR